MPKIGDSISIFLLGGIAMESLKKTKQKKNVLQIIKFAIFSISAGLIQMVAFTLMNEVGKADYWISYVVALSCSILWNFTFNRKFTFKSAANVPRAMFLAFCFYIPFAPLSILWGSALEKIGWNEYLVLLFTMVINLTCEFVWQKFVVFRDSYKKEKTESSASTDENLGDSNETEEVLENSEQPNDVDKSNK